MTLLRTIVMLGWLATGASPAGAAVGTSGGQILLEPVAARPASLGEAYAAVGGTVEALGYNPAGLAELPEAEGSALVRQGFAGDTYASVLGGGGFRGYGLAAGVSYLTTGSVEQIDPTGRVSSVTAESDLVMTAGIARPVPGVPVCVGASAKVIRSTLLEESAANDYAADLGVQGTLASAGLRFGASVQHWGGHLRYDDAKWPVDNNPLPLLWRFGASWTLAVPVGGSTLGTMESLAAPEVRAAPPPHVLRVLGEAVLRRLEHATGYGGGLEYAYGGWAFVRGGYRILASGGAARDTAWSVGAGVAFLELRLDYAAEFLSFTTVHRFGLSFIRLPE